MRPTWATRHLVSERRKTKHKNIGGHSQTIADSIDKFETAILESVEGAVRIEMCKKSLLNCWKLNL